MATTDAVKDKTCVDQIGFGWSLVCAGPSLAGYFISQPRPARGWFSGEPVGFPVNQLVFQ